MYPAYICIFLHESADDNTTLFPEKCIFNYRNCMINIVPRLLNVLLVKYEFLLCYISNITFLLLNQ